MDNWYSSCVLKGAAMAIYRFGAKVDKGDNRNFRKIEFEYDDDKLLRCWADDEEISAKDAKLLFRLDTVHSPGYAPPCEPNTRQNAVAFLVWSAFSRFPDMTGDPGEFEPQKDDTPEGAVN